MYCAGISLFALIYFSDCLDISSIFEVSSSEICCWSILLLNLSVAAASDVKCIYVCIGLFSCCAGLLAGER